MLPKLNKRDEGFTLVEIMVVVAIIAMLATIAVPNFLRARKRSQATQILSDLRTIDSAVDLYAMENNRSSGTVPWAAVQPYFKRGSKLYNSNNRDILGNSFAPPFTVDKIPNVPAASRTALSDIAPDSFWSPYIGN